MKAAKKTLIPGKAAKARPTRREALEVRPLRNPELRWYEDDGVVVLHIVREQTRKTRLLNLFVPLPEERKIELDKMGSAVWRLCDGQTALRTIAQTLAKEYQLEQREAEISVGQFFINLQRRGFVVLLRGEEAQGSVTQGDTTQSGATQESRDTATERRVSRSQPDTTQSARAKQNKAQQRKRRK